jgi:short-subunit dehydrogenase
MKSMRHLSVVVTGSSSGIGRATACAFAAQGAKLTLAARRGWLLDEVAEECRRLGGRAVTVQTDVTDPESVAALADAAEAAFGGIDVWVNNAGTGVIGPFQNAALDLHRLTIEVNLLGALYGAYAVLPRFLRRRRGTLVNVISMGGWVPSPFSAAYTASKFGLRGLTASLRQEVGDYEDIHICGVFPAIIDTPGLHHGANVTGRAIEPGGLIYPAEDVARAILSVVREPRDEVAVGWPARAARIAYGVAPGTTEHLVGQLGRRTARSGKTAPFTEGALRRPVRTGTGVSGGFRDGRRGSGHWGWTLAIAGAALLAGTAAAARR